MKFLCRSNIMIALMLPLAASANEWTVTQPIKSLQVYGTTQELYLTGISPWGASSCPTAIYAKVSVSLPGYKQILVAGLAAKMGETPIRLFGTCGTNGYFDVTHISVES